MLYSRGLLASAGTGVKLEIFRACATPEAPGLTGLFRYQFDVIKPKCIPFAAGVFTCEGKLK